MTPGVLKQYLKDEISQSGKPWQLGFTCAYCKRTLDPKGTPSLLEATKDHVQPRGIRAKGVGTWTVWCCYTCNHLKGNLSFQSWYQFMKSHPKWWEKKKVQRGENPTRKKKLMSIVDTNGNNVIDLPMRQPSHNLKLYTGGKPPSTGNWLLDLPLGSKFTVYSKSEIKNFMCLDLELVNKTNKCAVLWELSTGQPLGGNGRVIANRFTMQFDFAEFLPSWEDIGIPEEKEETTEKTDGDSNRPTGEIA